MKQREFYAKLTALASLVPNFVLSPELIGVYDQYLSPLGYAQLCGALDQIILRRSSRDPFPSIREIRELISPDSDPEQEAAVIAARIVGAISRIGPYQSLLAKDHLGEVGWAVVQSEGGWENICTVITNDNIGVMKAQWRNLAKAFLKRGVQALPQLPPSPKGRGLVSFGQMMKEISADSRQSEEGSDEEPENVVRIA